MDQFSISCSMGMSLAEALITQLALQTIGKKPTWPTSIYILNWWIQFPHQRNSDRRCQKVSSQCFPPLASPQDCVLTPIFLSCSHDCCGECINHPSEECADDSVAVSPLSHNTNAWICGLEQICFRLTCTQSWRNDNVIQTRRCTNGPEPQKLGDSLKTKI